MDDRLDRLDVRLDKLDTRLDKLDEKLRVVDTMWDTRYRLDTLDRRLGDLDSKVERRMGELDSTLERRFDKLTESVASHDHKDSSAKDQLVRKVDNVYERIIYMENNSINKIQVTASSILDKAQSASAELHRVAEQAEQAVGQAVGQARAELRAGLAALHAQVNATHDHVLNATTAVAMQAPQEDDESERRVCVDAGETTTKTIKQHIDVKTDLMSSKVSNLYNDMWRRVNTLESTVKSIVSLSNATRRDVQALNVAVAGVQHGSRGYPRQPALEPGNLEYALNLHHTALERQLRELRDTLLDELRNVQQVQDTFLSTCNRLNDKDHSMDEKLGRVLVHHTEYLLQHRNVLAEVKRQLKTHSTVAGRAASNATEGIKRLEAAVRGLTEHGRLEVRRIEQALERVDNASVAMQNASDRMLACGGSLGAGLGVGLGVGLGAGAGLAEEEAAWSELLQHNESLVTVTAPNSQPAISTATSTASSPSTTAASVDGVDLALVDSNGLQRPPPKEPPGGQGQGQGLGQVSQEGAAGNGLHREQRRGAVEQQVHSTDSSQDSVTDLSSVDEDDYAETDDDEADLLD
ncbi:uncharacterized protein LOC117650577 [Thrips palmi]|uniref:Uncharacterized protein LOC117650577 n=1 Tax=Thrips palmi TaxID=161013 RepID=A0A6P8ZY18_THRPL|nr:uncharacterized protein LOC117650577 [Thrips palmi]